MTDRLKSKGTGSKAILLLWGIIMAFNLSSFQKMNQGQQGAVSFQQPIKMPLSTFLKPKASRGGNLSLSELASTPWSGADMGVTPEATISDFGPGGPPQAENQPNAVQAGWMTESEAKGFQNTALDIFGLSEVGKTGFGTVKGMTAVLGGPFGIIGKTVASLVTKAVDALLGRGGEDTFGLDIGTAPNPETGLPPGFIGKGEEAPDVPGAVDYGGYNAGFDVPGIGPEGGGYGGFGGPGVGVGPYGGPS